MTTADLAADRTLVISRLIAAPRSAVWVAWTDPVSLPQWWGPEGFSCRTSRITLGTGGEWVFDMIGPDGTVYPNHHRYVEVRAPECIAYTLLSGENGPKHADAVATFSEEAGGTRVTLTMVMNSAEEYRQAREIGAEELGQQTLAKLERRVLAG